MSLQLAVLDPGAWLSLSAAEAIATVAEGVGLHFVIARVDASDGPPEPEDSLKEAKVITLKGPAEMELLLQYATVAAEDEAAAAALAHARGLPLISDEVKLRRAFESHTRHGSILFSLPEILQQWQTKRPAQASAIQSVLTTLQLKAHYLPPRGLPGFDWLRSSLASSAKSSS